MRKITKRAAAVVAASVIAVGAGGAAFAYAAGWFNGSGTVVATSSTIQPVTASINIGSSDSTRLFPGKTIAVTAPSVVNNNDYPVQINNVTSFTLTSTKAACGAAEADLSFADFPDATVPAHSTASNVNLGSMTMAQTADPACAGAVFTVSAVLGGEIGQAPAANGGGRS
ncbi:hypothetical protein AB0M54_01940 [Actinoplanes sp. NPDC051470]|uniref:hypothetical protein n=1 Tax=Actinoplanes sp. NPDC051470 TaxID=3157224 RepID=UPI00343CCD60